MNNFDHKVMLHMAETLLSFMRHRLSNVNSLSKAYHVMENAPYGFFSLDIIKGWQKLQNKSDYCPVRVDRQNRLTTEPEDKDHKEPEERQKRLPAVGIQGLVALLITSSELDQPKFFPRLSLELVVGGAVVETKTTVVDPKVLFNGKFCEKEQYVPVDPDVPVFPRPERRLLILHYFHEAPVIFKARKIDDTLSPAPPNEVGQKRTSPAYVKVRIEQKKLRTQIPVVEGDEKWITIGWAKLHCYEEYIPADGPQTNFYRPANGQTIYQIEKGTREDLFPETEWPQNIGSEWTTDGPYKFYENEDNVLSSRKLLLLLAGSQLSATVFNPETDRPDTILPVIKKVVKVKPGAVHKEHALKPLNIPVMEQDSRSPPVTPLDECWVAFRKPTLGEREMRPSLHSEPFCIYIDQLRFMPDYCSVYKVTGKLLNTGWDSEMPDILVIPDMTIGSPLIPKGQRQTHHTPGSLIRSPLFRMKDRIVVQVEKEKALSVNSLLFLRVFTKRITDGKVCIVGNVLMRLFDDQGILHLGGHQKRLRCRIPEHLQAYDAKTIYWKDELEATTYLPCATICLRLLPYTEEPIEAAAYRERNYRSIEAEPTEMEWEIYHLYESEPQTTCFYEYIQKQQRRKQWIFSPDIPSESEMREFVLEELSTDDDPVQATTILPFRYHHRAGFELSVLKATHLSIKPGDFVFALGKFMRGPNARILSENRELGYGTDDDLLFHQLDPINPMSDPVWTSQAILTKPYGDDDAILVIQLFAIPLGFRIDGDIFVGHRGSWFKPTRKKFNRIWKARRRQIKSKHMIGWSVIRLLERKFLRYGIHELAVFPPPIQLHWLRRVQEKSEQALISRGPKPFPYSRLTIRLTDGHFLNYRRELNADNEEPTFSQLAKVQPTAVPQKTFKFRTSVNSLVEYRRQRDQNWPERGEYYRATKHLLEEVRKLIEMELKLCLSKARYEPLFLSYW
ncbi:hypothetical protein CLF_103433 [Clonorchis sinensis]|uniref:Uncharacterized protein n=1 Tax=Clonorchis sinensis TaxID=79923 RepID=H2KQ87_CLOSI|nr:hypothetical protein CLF_103433 [Clonorchis sinensis]